MSSLFSSRYRGVSAVVAALGMVAVVAIVVQYAGSESKPGAQPVAEVRAAAAFVLPAVIATTAESTAGAPREEEPTTSPLRPEADLVRMRAVSEAVRRAFPSITEVTADWRNFRPESVTVAPHPDLPVKFTRTALRDEGRYVTWIGRNPDLPGASFVGVATAKGYDAILVMPGSSQFSFHVRGDEVVIAESNPGQEGCGNLPVQLARDPAPESAGNILQISYEPGHTPLPDAYAETAPLKVDVLFAYDADTLAAATARSSTDPVGYIDGQCKALVETANLALSQSLVTAFAWRHLGVVAAPAYTRTGKLQDDLNAMRPSGAIGSWVINTRYQRGADQITLIVGGDNDWGGVAASSRQTAVSVNSAISVAKWGNSFKLFAHEWAHNFGCQHDRAHYEVPLESGPNGTPTAAADNDGFWCYGQLWQNPPPPPGFASGTTGDIMSYADWIIPYFSNPNITLQVTGSMVGRSSTLELGTHQIGRPENDPKAAYNVRVLNEQALAMSNISEEIAMPAITRQPASISVQRGQNLQLGVNATGGGLVYEWMKGGVVLSAGAAAIYSKTAEDADAGTYTVTIKNMLGSVTSDAVTVTVTQPPPPTPAPAVPVAGSGGGGGAPSLWFLGLLALGSVARWRASRRS